MTGRHEFPDEEGIPTILPQFILGQITPAEALAHLVQALHTTELPDPEVCSEVGCGDLESVLQDHETELWPEIERLAREDVRFRRALRSAWAYDSPEFERREALLVELGEMREIAVRFTVEPEDFSEHPPLAWRALEIEGQIDQGQLASILRRVADRLERDQSS